MSNANHTPGPWTQADRVIVTTHETHGYATWLANCAVGGLSEAEQLANAQLMRAAPELLEALQAMLEQFNYSTVAGLFHDESMAIMKAREAIAKATGEQPK